MEDRKVFAGIGALIIILLLIAIFSSGSGDDGARAALENDLAAAEDRATALETQVDELRASLADVKEQIAGAVTADDLAAVQGSVEALGDDLATVQGSVAEMNSDSATIGGDLATLAERIAATEALAAEAKTLADAAQHLATQEPRAVSAVEPSAETSETTEPELATTDASSSDGAKPGETVSFGDGRLRVFVSKLDTEAQTVRVSIDGVMKTLASDESRTYPVGADYCRMTVNGVSESGAVFSALCGDDLPAPEGLRVGETAILADGALRVFASRVTDETARLQAGGRLIELETGHSAAVTAGDESCRVKVDAVDRGHVQVSAECGAIFAVSEPAGPGRTVSLGDGAARVFVAALNADGSVRVAVNGQDTATVAAGDSLHLTGGCQVNVEDVTREGAAFSYSCDG